MNVAAVGIPRALVIAPQPFYQDRGTPIAVDYVLRSLTELGYEVDLLTYPVGSSPEIPGVRYIRVANPLRFRSIPVGFSWKKLFLDGLIAFRLLGLAGSRRYRYIHAVEESAFLAVAMRGIHRAPVVYDMASSLPEQLALVRFFRWPPALAACRSLEAWLLARVDAVVASAGLEPKVRSIAPGTPVREWFYPSFAPRLAPEELLRLRNELGMQPGDRAIVYTGTFEAYQGIEELLQAIPAVLEVCPDALFLFVGARDQAQADQLAAKLPMDVGQRVRIAPRVPKAQVAGYLQLAEVLVSPRAVGGNVPLKIFDYLAAERLVVATDIEAHRAIVDERLALLVPPTATGLAQGITRSLSDTVLAQRLTAAASAYANERLSWRAFVEFMARLLQSLPDPGRPAKPGRGH